MTFKPNTDFLVGYAWGLVTALWLTMLAGCDLREPDNREVDAPAWAAEAAEWSASEWATRFPQMGTEYEIPTIRWFAGDCLTWPYIPDPHSCTQGMYFDDTLGPREIQVLASNQFVIAHELLHWTLDDTAGDLDGGHDGSAWEQVIPVQLGLCEYLHPGATCEVAGEDHDHPPADEPEPQPEPEEDRGPVLAPI